MGNMFCDKVVQDCFLPITPMLLFIAVLKITYLAYKKQGVQFKNVVLCVHAGC